MMNVDCLSCIMGVDLVVFFEQIVEYFREEAIIVLVDKFCYVIKI